MFFSVLIPVYNAAETLKRCIDSVLKQSCPDFELILCDDKSTDDSLQIMKNYAAMDDRIKILTHEVNKGRTAAHYDLNQAAQAPYSICIDADDEIDADFLKTGREILEKEHWDLINFPCELRFPDGTKKFQVLESYQLHGDNMLMEYLQNRSFHGAWWSKIYSTEILRNTEPLTRKDLLADDVFFMAPLWYQVKSYCYVKTSRPMYIYYGCTGQWSKLLYEMTPEKFEKRCQLCYEIVVRNVEFYKSKGFGDEYINAMLRLYNFEEMLFILKSNHSWRQEGIAIFRKYFLKDGNLLSDGSVAARDFAAYYEAKIKSMEEVKKHVQYSFKITPIKF